MFLHNFDCYFKALAMSGAWVQNSDVCVCWCNAIWVMTGRKCQTSISVSSACYHPPHPATCETTLELLAGEHQTLPTHWRVFTLAAGFTCRPCTRVLRTDYLLRWQRAHAQCQTLPKVSCATTEALSEKLICLRGIPRGDSSINLIWVGKTVFKGKMCGPKRFPNEQRCSLKQTLKVIFQTKPPASAQH